MLTIAAELVKELVATARQKDSVLDFSIVLSDGLGKYALRPVGSVQAVGKGKDDLLRLDALNYQIGAGIDVTIRPWAKRGAYFFIKPKLLHF